MGAFFRFTVPAGGNAMKLNRILIGVALFATAFSAWAAAGCPLGCC
jgi:hypothetical protein